MSDFQKPPISRDQPPKGWIGVHRLEKDKKDAPFEDLEIAPKQATLMTVSLAGFLKKILHFLIPSASTTKSEIANLDKHHIEQQLLEFKKMLMSIARDDQSHNPDFIQQLSSVWQELLQVCNDEYMTKKFPNEALKLRLLAKQLSLFPPSEDHSFGSYLSKHVGANWLPFPLINIIQELHFGYQKDPRLSEISVWLSFLNEIIHSFEN